VELKPSLISDWRVWDSTTPAVIHSARRPIVDPAALAQPDSFQAIPCIVKPRNIIVSERAASFGRYTSRDRVILLPTQNLPGQFYAKPSDIVEILDDGSRWVVQTADLRTRGTWWRLETLDLQIEKKLFQTVNIERATLSYDSAGFAVKTFPPAGGSTLYADLPASVQLITEEIANQRGIRAFLGNYSITVARQVSVTFDDRVTWTDLTDTLNVFDILAVQNPERIDELPLLVCALKP
jgi:hypothetical protein